MLCQRCSPLASGDAWGGVPVEDSRRDSHSGNDSTPAAASGAALGLQQKKQQLLTAQSQPQWRGSNQSSNAGTGDYS